MSRLPYVTAWFVFEDYEMLNLVLKTAQELKISEIRTAFSWADWERDGGPQWFDHFIKRCELARVRLMPCLFYTPPHKARGKPITSCPPKRLGDYADFLEEMITRYGRMFDWVQLWNEPNWDVYWNWEADPHWLLFAEMVGHAIPVAKRYKKKVALGGLAPFEYEWTEKMFEYGVLQDADALGIHAFPGTWGTDVEGSRRKGRPWRGLSAEIEDARGALRKHGSEAEVWLTETGYSTYGTGEFLVERYKGQVEYFKELLEAPAGRVYWHTVVDQRPEAPTDNELTSGLPNDDRAYHFGIVDVEGNPKPLYRFWKEKTL